MSRAAAAAATAALLLAAPPASAQGTTHTIVARATLSLPAVTGAGVQNLDFGPLAVGATGDVPPGPPAAGTSSAGWRFTGIRKNRPIGLTFALPAALIGPGATPLPVDWDNADYGTFCAAGGSGCAWSTTFNPGANLGVHTVTIPSGTPGNNYDVLVYAGARTTVPAVPPGVYTAAVTLTMAYLF